jgi:hypothetical protein
VEFFCGEQRKSVSHVETHLVTKNADGSGSGAVRFFDAFGEYAVEQVKILFHC